MYELLVRGHLIDQHTIPVKKLHSKSVEMVRASAQAKAYDFIIDKISEDEGDILRRGRNATISRVPKNSSVEEYHKATAIEALFGYLYLERENERIGEIFKMILEEGDS